MNDDYYARLNQRYTDIYSTGGIVEKSFHQNVGKKYNKNYEDANKANQTIEEIFARITDKFYSRKK